jgi:hypothetical protein
MVRLYHADVIAELSHAEALSWALNFLDSVPGWQRGFIRPSGSSQI